MKPLAFGWILPSGPATGRATYVQSVERGLALIQGHFDSAWMVDHLQFEQADLLEGWTASTYFAARTPDLLFGHTVLCQSTAIPLCWPRWRAPSNTHAMRNERASVPHVVRSPVEARLDR